MRPALCQKCGVHHKMAGLESRRVLSMDVGMRHLGVAILQYTPPSALQAGLGLAPPVPHVELLCVYDVLQQCGSSAKCTGVSKLDMVRLMCQFLHSMEQTWDALHVTDLVVESQVRKSPKNLNIMVTLFAWFYGLHLRHQLAVPTHVVPRLFQVSAKNKLTLSDTPCTKVSYPQRKKQAVDHLRQLAHAGEVTIAPSWHVRYSIEKKRDDMADAVLQALWYIRHKIQGHPESCAKPKKAAGKRAKKVNAGKTEPTVAKPAKAAGKRSQKAQAGKATVAKPAGKRAAGKTETNDAPKKRSRVVTKPAETPAPTTSLFGEPPFSLPAPSPSTALFPGMGAPFVNGFTVTPPPWWTGTKQ